jgi:hypothetical protein
VKEVFKKNLGMGLLNLKVFEEILRLGEWAPPFFGASSPTPLPLFSAMSASSHTATGPAAQQ